MATAARREELDAIYQDGVFRPLSRPALSEGARVHLSVENTSPSAADPLELAGQVYDDLTPTAVEELERLILERGAFFTDRSG